MPTTLAIPANRKPNAQSPPALNMRENAVLPEAWAYRRHFGPLPLPLVVVVVVVVILIAVPSVLAAVPPGPVAVKVTQ